MTGTGSLLSAPLPEPPWGTLVATYLVVIGLPSGLGLVTCWLATQRVVGGAWLERRANLVSLSALVVVGVLLVADLGRPGGFFLMLTRFDNLASPIALGAKLVAVKTALVALAVYAGERDRRTARVPVPAGGGGVGEPPPLARGPGAGSGPAGAALQRLTRTLVAAASFALAIYPAALLSRTWSAPLGGTSGSALLFLTTSLLLGGAAVVAITVARSRADAAAAPAVTLARRLLLVLLAGHAIAVALQALAVTGDPRLDGVVSSLATGGYAPLWWAGAVAAGMAVPVTALLLFPRRHEALLLAAAGAAAGAGITRYLLFAAGG